MDDEVRKQVLARTRKSRGTDKGKILCYGCAKSFADSAMEIDHILPTSKGGSDNLSNLQALCTECNRIKSDNTMEDLWDVRIEGGTLTATAKETLKRKFYEELMFNR